MTKIIGVIGAGLMGNGIAHVASLAGYTVKLVDINPDQLKRARETIAANLSRQAKRGKIGDKAVKDALARIEFGADYGLLADCDVVIEAATENERVKTELYKAIAPHLKKDAIIASNTSSIPITRGAGLPARRNCSRMYCLSKSLTVPQSRCNSSATSLTVLVRHRRPTKYANRLV